MIIIKVIKLMIKKNNNVVIIYGISIIGFFIYFVYFFEMINFVYFWNVFGRYRKEDRVIIVQMVSKDILLEEMKYIICLIYYIKYVILLY